MKLKHFDTLAPMKHDLEYAREAVEELLILSSHVRNPDRIADMAMDGLGAIHSIEQTINAYRTSISRLLSIVQRLGKDDLEAAYAIKDAEELLNLKPSK